ncbi:hypothetical protein HYS93_00535 [Candidatus Daviesbacteria bacterium]|nr:hypothetical protein [Candidatus Daviesbacteria bacterium]
MIGLVILSLAEQMKKLIIFTVSAIIAGLAIYFFFTQPKQSSPSSLIKDLKFDKLTFKEKIYRIEDNGNIEPKDENYSQVVNLAAFYQWTKEDPLFYSPDFNTEEFFKTVEYYKKEQTNLLRVIEQITHIYPTDFQDSFANTAKVTEEFLRNPSDELAEKLIKSQIATINSYRSEINSLIQITSPLKEVEPVTFNLKTSSKIFLSDYKRIAENANALQVEIDRRVSCLREGKACQRPAFSFVKIDKIYPIPEDKAPERLLDKKTVLNYPQLKREIKVRGPYQAYSPCTGLNEQDLSWPNLPYYISDLSTTNIEFPDIPAYRFELASNVFFRRVNKTPILPGDDQINKLGLDYIYQSATAIYMCPYQAYFNEITQNDLFLKENKPFLNNFKSLKNLPPSFSKIVSQAKSYEETIFSKRYQSFADLENLANLYGYLYRLVAEGRNFKESDQINPLKEELLRRSLIIKRKLGGYNLVLNSVLFHLRTSTYREIIRPNPDLNTVVAYNYFMNTAYSLMYLPFTRSVWRLSDNLQYHDKVLVKGVIGFEGPYFDYYQALERYSKEGISKWFVHEVEILADLAQEELKTNYPQ